MAKVGAIYGMGNPLLDISAHVDEKFLAKYDLKAENAILAEEKHVPIYGELVANHKVSYIAGGSTQNTIRIAQWVLQKTPRACSYVGCIGSDDFGKKLSDCALADGVNAVYLEDAEQPTGTCAVLVTGHGQRSLVANLAAANHYKIEHLKRPETWDLVKNADLMYIAGFFLTVSVESALAVAEEAFSANKLFMMNLAAPFIPQFFKEALDKMSPFWDIIFGNESEATAFATAQGWEETDVEAIALRTAALPKKNEKRSRIVVYTQGAQPTIVVVDGKATQYPVIPIEPENIVDTNGAGDSFVGGFLAQLALGKPIDECVRCGHWCANLIIKRDGCTYPEVCDY
jgi:adenosine kinase